MGQIKISYSELKAVIQKLSKDFTGAPHSRDRFVAIQAFIQLFYFRRSISYYNAELQLLLRCAVHGAARQV